MKKFRDMTDSEKLEIISAMIVGDPIECYLLSPAGYNWVLSYSCQSIWLDNCYRIPKRQMSIDWSVLKDEYICAARDPNGVAYAFVHKPEKEGYWLSIDMDSAQIDHLKSYDPGTVDWKDSLIWRPGYEPK